MSLNPFVLEKKDYVRNLNIVAHYVRDTATYLSIMSDKDIKICEDYVRTNLRHDGRFPFKDPKVAYLDRNMNGDRTMEETTLLRYIGDSVRERELIAPTFTTYRNPNIRKSLLVGFIDGNVKARGKAKKEQFRAKQAGNKQLETLKKGEQTNRKLGNNAVSGAHVSASTPVYNKSAHSTLTSTCRTTSGYGNANNEKFTTGNRHYWSPDIVRNNIISIINNTDLLLLQQALTKFNIRYPTVQETIDCYQYSAKLYWFGKNEYDKIDKLISKLSDIQRAAFVYVGDFYHLMKYNQEFVYAFIDRLSTKVVKRFDSEEEIDKIINSTREDIHILAKLVMNEELKGKSIDSIKGTQDYHTYGATIENAESVIQEHALMIRALWVTPVVPASVAVFPDSIRRCAVTSDTDSTIFTVQDWVTWFNKGPLAFDWKSIAVANTVVFLASQTITHVLAMMSANFGIETDRIHQIAMKNEYFFPVFCPTQVAKHYFAFMSCQEGNVFKELEKEIKGVHLKSSNSPKSIIKEATSMMEFIMNSVLAGNQISMVEMLTRVANIERNIVASIKEGDHEYFRLAQVKIPESYREGENSAPYQQFLFWEEVFAPKYGSAGKPPYGAIKVNVDINTPVKANEWINSIKDPDLKARLVNWLNKKGIKQFPGTLLIPENCVSSRGIPEEIMSVMGIRKIVKDTSNIFYIILEAIGYYALNNSITRLCMDDY